MKELSWFNGESKKSKSDKDGILSSAGRGAVKVGTVIGAGILVGMGFNAFKDASEGN